MIKKSPGRKSNSAKRSELNDLFAELKSEYLDTFTEKTEAIHNFWAKQDRNALQNEFHKIKGTGTTYGIPEVTTIAEILEEMCEINSPQLGTAIMVTLELFQKICHAYKFGGDYDLRKDPLFKAVETMHRAAEHAS